MYDCKERSELEKQFEKLFLRKLGCPVENVLKPQYPVFANGRQYYIDYAYISGYKKIAIELDGLGKIFGGDEPEEKFKNLLERQNNISEEGFSFRRFTWDNVVKHDGEKVIETLRKIFEEEPTSPPDKKEKTVDIQARRQPVAQPDESILNGQKPTPKPIIPPPPPPPPVTRVGETKEIVVPKPKERGWPVFFIFLFAALFFLYWTWTPPNKYRKDPPPPLKPEETRPSRLSKNLVSPKEKEASRKIDEGAEPRIDEDTLPDSNLSGIQKPEQSSTEPEEKTPSPPPAFTPVSLVETVIIDIPISSIQPRTPVDIHLQIAGASGYIREIRERIFFNWKRPLRTEPNEIVVSFIIFPGGNIENPIVVKTSRKDKLDRLAVQAILDSAPFPKFPEELKEPRLRITIRFKEENRGAESEAGSPLPGCVPMEQNNYSTC